jgi:hypothetical protein
MGSDVYKAMGSRRWGHKAMGSDVYTRRWGSGKEVRSPPPPPLRTVRAPFNAYGSSIGQRPFTERGLPIGLGVNLDFTTARPVTEIRRGPHHGRCRPRQICFAPRTGSLSVHVRRHPKEVSSLSRRVMSQPLSGPLQAGIRFLPRPLPAAPSVRLAAGLPSREGDGLTTLHRRNPRGLGPASTPVAQHLRRMSLKHPDLATYLLVQAYQHLWLVLINDANCGSPGLAIPRAPGPRPPRCWQSRPRLALRSPSLRMRIRCPEGFTPRRCRRRMPR